MEMKSGGRNWFLVFSLLEIVSLAVWVGGLLVIVAGVIPAVFNEGMERGGRILTRIFESYNTLVVGAICGLVGAALWRVWNGRMAGRTWMGIGRGEVLILTVMIILCAMIVLWLTPTSVMLQEQAFAARGVLEKKQAYEAFFKVHSVVRGLYVANFFLGVALLFVKLRKWVTISLNH